jgi:hypothetical protein
MQVSRVVVAVEKRHNSIPAHHTFKQLPRLRGFKDKRNSVVGWKANPWKVRGVRDDLSTLVGMRVFRFEECCLGETGKIQIATPLLSLAPKTVLNLGASNSGYKGR